MNYQDKFSLEGKVAFVCGGTGLIGRETSKALAAAGATTVILDIDRKRGKQLAQEIKKFGYDAHYEYFDLTGLKKIEKSINRLVSKYKSLDVWVNLAYPRTKDWGNAVEALKVDSLRKNVDMHLNSYAWTSRAAALIMKKKKIKGSIINFGSIYGVVANDFTVYEGTSMTSPMAYAMIKAGIVNVTKYLASYFGKYDIRVNSICPGGIFDHQNKTFMRNFEKKVPLKRMGKPEEMAPAVVFLSSEASSYVTGSTLMVDGGWTVV